MLMSASTDFVALCQSQLDFLAQSLGATDSAVYLAEDLEKGATTQLIPVAAYPDIATSQASVRRWLSLPEHRGVAASSTFLLPEQVDGKVQDSSSDYALLDTPESAPSQQQAPPLDEEDFSEGYRRVLPLVYQTAMMGFLVVGRDDRPWTSLEQSQLEGMAHSLAIARTLDQRIQWLEGNYRRQQQIQAQQRDLIDDWLHQLRNPLTALKTFGKLMVKRLLPEDKNRAIADSIVQESQRLQDMLQQFSEATMVTPEMSALPPAKSCPLPAAREGETGLEGKRLAFHATDDSLAPVVEIEAEIQAPEPTMLPEAGKQASELSNHPTLGTPLTLKPCSLLMVLDPLLATAHAIAQERDLQVQTLIPEALPPICADAIALREVLGNLIDNALKYTPPGGTVRIQVGIQETESAGAYQIIAISDTGPGIPQADLQKIFERHYRGIQAETDIPGTGLGLAIAQDLVRRMHGEIHAFSPALPWSVFTVEVVEQVPAAGVLSSSGEPGTTFVLWLPSQTKDTLPTS